MKRFPTVVLHFLVSVFLLSCSNDQYETYQSEKPRTVVLPSNIELEILSLINKYRVANNLTVLKVLESVSIVSETHTSYMVSEGKLSHDNFSTRKNILIESALAKAVGENVAYGYNTASAVLEAWINSEEHKKNIVNKSFTHFGLSSKKDHNGNYYFTNIYIAK